MLEALGARESGRRDHGATRKTSLKLVRGKDEKKPLRWIKLLKLKGMDEATAKFVDRSILLLTIRVSPDDFVRRPFKTSSH